jgi:hypothetical protein
MAKRSSAETGGERVRLRAEGLSRTSSAILTSATRSPQPVRLALPPPTGRPCRRDSRPATLAPGEELALLPALLSTPFPTRLPARLPEHLPHLLGESNPCSAGSATQNEEAIETIRVRNSLRR